MEMVIISNLKKYDEDLEKSEILDLIYYGNGHHSGDWLANELS